MPRQKGWMSLNHYPAVQQRYWWLNPWPRWCLTLGTNPSWHASPRSAAGASIFGSHFAHRRPPTEDHHHQSINIVTIITIITTITKWLFNIPVINIAYLDQNLSTEDHHHLRHHPHHPPCIFLSKFVHWRSPPHSSPTLNTITITLIAYSDKNVSSSACHHHTTTITTFAYLDHMFYIFGSHFCIFESQFFTILDHIFTFFAHLHHIFCIFNHILCILDLILHIFRSKFCIFGSHFCAYLDHIFCIFGSYFAEASAAEHQAMASLSCWKLWCTQLMPLCTSFLIFLHQSRFLTYCN